MFCSHLQFYVLQISSGSHAHLSDLSQIKFLVLDEADRMVQKHCFPQLLQILETVHNANPGLPDGDDTDDESDDDDSDDDENHLESLPGVRGEAKVTMLSDEILLRLAAQRDGTVPEAREVPEEDFEESDDEDDEAMGAENMFDGDMDRPPVHRQTFIYSATLTLPQTETMPKPTKQKRRQRVNLDGPIADILSKTRAMGETKVVDLSSKLSKTNNGSHLREGGASHAGSGGGVRLPPGLNLEQIKCTQRHKDSHLYAYLLTTAQGSSGPSLVFCNSIACVRRVGTTLQKLNLPVRILHAHMQQVREIAFENPQMVAVEPASPRRDLSILAMTKKILGCSKLNWSKWPVAVVWVPSVNNLRAHANGVASLVVSTFK